MADGKVHHMNIIAYARAVRRRIIVAENAHFIQLAHRNFCDIRAQIVGDPVRILADQSRFVCSHGIEIAQNRDIERIVSLIKVAQNIFDKQFCPSVRIGRGKREILFDRNGMRVSVNGRRRGEYKIFAPVFAHRFQ